MHVGFLGLGVMGVPMALTYPAGSKVGDTPSQVLEQSDITFMMLFNGAAIESLLDDNFKRALRGKTLVNTSSVSVEFSQFLAHLVREAGGNFIEMPVSGSKVPAEQGQLVGLMAGDASATESIRPVVEPITCAAVYCGPIGFGLKTKYAVNLYLVTMTAGLAEAMNLAQAQGLDLNAFGQALEAGPLASPYSKLKVGKMLGRDWSAQATIKDCYNSTKLIESAAIAANTHSPLLQLCGSLYGQANQSGLGEDDMIAVAKVLANF